MIIPVRCFTCGKVIADKYNTYQNLVDENRKSMGMPQKILFLKFQEIKWQKHQRVKPLDQVGLKRYCCRRMMLSHINLIDVI